MCDSPGDIIDDALDFFGDVVDFAIGWLKPDVDIPDFGTTDFDNTEKGIFRMDADTYGWEANAVSTYGFTFSCTQAF